MPREWLFDPKELMLDPPTTDVAEECTVLQELEAKRSQRQERIAQQVYPNGAFLPLLEALGLAKDYERPDRRRDELVVLIYRNIFQPTFVFKRQCLRARPSRMCPALHPLFPRSDGDRHPGHPAYPSGHATFAYTWAYLLRAKLAVKHAALGVALMDVAKEVAENREWAGLHYASDTLAGHSLGKQIAEKILDKRKLSDQDFALLMHGLT